MYDVKVSIQNSEFSVCCYDLGKHWGSGAPFAMSREFVFEAVELVAHINEKELNVTEVAFCDHNEVVKIISRKGNVIEVSFGDSTLVVKMDGEVLFCGHPGDLPYPRMAS